MRIIRGSEIDFIPASHEDPKDPGVLKKVLVKRDELIQGRIQMINWARMEVGKAFESHYHEDMEEVFVILTGRAEIVVDGERGELEAGDAVLIPVRGVHQMRNMGSEVVEYIALGVSNEQGGKTINV